MTPPTSYHDYARITGTASAPVGLIESTNYLEDDWDDNSLTSRTNPSDGVYAHPDANEAGDTLIGRYRPEWNVKDPTNTTVNSGTLVIPQNSDDTSKTVAVPSNFITGSFSSDIGINSAGTSGERSVFSFISKAVDPSTVQDFYGIRKNSESSESNDDLSKFVGGSLTILITGPTTSNNTKNYEATRDTYGDFEFFSSATSYGTAVDTDIVTTNTVLLYSSASSSNYDALFDNLVVQ